MFRREFFQLLLTVLAVINTKSVAEGCFWDTSVDPWQYRQNIDYVWKHQLKATGVCDGKCTTCNLSGYDVAL
jgi:hypothetical protein